MERFIVRTETLKSFLDDYSIANNNHNIDWHSSAISGRCVIEKPLSLVQNEIFIKKEAFKKGEKYVDFIIDDKSEFSGQPLICTCLYSIEQHDDIAVKLVLTDIQIVQKK